MKLTRLQASADVFAFPRTRQSPIHDEKHLRMAWGVVDTVANVTEIERMEARAKILARAKELNIDTTRWLNIATMSLELSSLSAMSLTVPTTEDHPNKMEFSGVLTKVDQASDLAPHGSYGKKVLIPKAVAEKALPTLLGMGIDLTTDMKGHDRKKKIGVITAANVDGTDVRISGFFYANDFPKEVTMIQANKELLGFSFEAERILVADLESDPLRIESLIFTGAAVLKKNSAAYHETSIAAQAEENEMTKEELQAILAAALDPLNKRLDKMEQTRVEAASVADKVADHAKNLKATAAAMAAAGIGCHATRGHAAILNHMADEMMAEAHRGSIPSMYHGMSMYGSADAGPDAETKKQLKELKEGLDAATAENKSLKTKVTDLEAKASAGNGPERKTLPARITSLMAKGNITIGDDGQKLTVQALDAALKSTSLTTQDRLELKVGLERAGLLVKSAA